MVPKPIQVVENTPSQGPADAKGGSKHPKKVTPFASHPQPLSPKLQKRNNLTHASPQHGRDMNAFSLLRSRPWLTIALAVTFAPIVHGQNAPTVANPLAVDPNTGQAIPTSNPTAIDPTTGQPIPGSTRPLDALNPIPSWTALLATAKAAEEGDADLATASDQYQTLVRIFDQLRPVAAEALYRYALVEAKREHGDEAQAAHTRLIQWFPDFTEYVKKSLEARGGNASSPSLPDGDTGSAPATTFRMSPELMRRYGLTSPPASAEPDAGSRGATMSPELMARYGLRSGPATPAANASVPRDLRSAELAELHERRSELVAVSSRTAADLRKARLELNRVDGLGIMEIPPNLISDQRLATLIVGLDDGLTDLTQEQIDKIQKGRRSKINEYFEVTYKPRLRVTVEILSRELDQLRIETRQIDEDILKLQRALQPKF